MSKKILTAVIFIIIVSLYYYFNKSNSTLSAVAKAQFEAIQAGDIAKAYSFMTTEFQQQTPSDAFNAFIGGYPTLQQATSFSISNSKTTKDTGTVTAIVTDSNNHKMQLDYQFANENKNWRIEGLRIAPINDEETKMLTDNTGTSIQAIVVSDEADADGYVTKGKATLNKLAAKIYATIQVKAPKAGGKIETSITQISNGAKIGPSIDEISKAGNVLKAFAFTRVTNTWAEGDYEIIVKLSSGDTKALKFQVK
jgi:hypothetical protein